MIFGQVERPELVDFSLPLDHPDTARVLKSGREDAGFEVSVGCAKWNKKDLKNFYPRGTKDELKYYSTQFNSIELNATFYQSPSKQQVATWRDKTPEGFLFYPKLPNTISHYKQLVGVQEVVELFAEAVNDFEDRLGISFLQLHDRFGPDRFERLERFIMDFPKELPLAVEVRNKDWFDGAADRLFQLLEDYHKVNIIVDTAGRRDMVHMRLTSPVAFVRYVGANHPSDYTRLDDWIERISVWKAGGLKKLCFFIHQNVELESPLLAAYFIEKLNKAVGTQLTVPETLV